MERLLNQIAFQSCSRIILRLLTNISRHSFEVKFQPLNLLALLTTSLEFVRTSDFLWWYRAKPPLNLYFHSKFHFSLEKLPIVKDNAHTWYNFNDLQIDHDVSNADSKAFYLNLFWSARCYNSKIEYPHFYIYTHALLVSIHL